MPEWSMTTFILLSKNAFTYLERERPVTRRACMASVPAIWKDDVPQLAPLKPPLEVVRKQREDAHLPVANVRRDMRGGGYPRMGPKGARRWKRFLAEYVDCCMRDRSVVQQTDQCRFI